MWLVVPNIAVIRHMTTKLEGLMRWTLSLWTVKVCHTKKTWILSQCRGIENSQTVERYKQQTNLFLVCAHLESWTRFLSA